MLPVKSGSVRKLVKIFSIEDASLEEDMAELRKEMYTMPANFINEDERAGLDSAVCRESHAELEVNITNDHQAENLNMSLSSLVSCTSLLGTRWRPTTGTTPTCGTSRSWPVTWSEPSPVWRLKTPKHPENFHVKGEFWPCHKLSVPQI